MSKTAPVEMIDAVTAANIDPATQVVAGYLDGRYAWSRQDWARFPDAEKVLITVTGDLRGNVADVENGDLTPEQGAEWIRAKQAAGLHGCTIYCNLSTLPAVLAACHGLHYYLWIADWTNSPHDVDGAVAVQFMNTPQIDRSMVYSQEWLNVINQVNQPWPLG